MSRVGVVGAGYVGATTAACLAHLGHDVVCADVDERLVDRLNDCNVPILEVRLPQLIRAGRDAGRLIFTAGAADAGRDVEFIFICVNTPQRGDGSADLSHVEAAIADIAGVVGSEVVVVNKSTMPIGSAAYVKSLLAEHGRGDVLVAVNPEFLQEGTAVQEFLHPERIVLGVEEEETAVRLSLLYRKLQARIIVTDPTSAEMIKYASNAYLATRISFINSIANLCEVVGADVTDVALGMGYDSRIGSAVLRPGPGYGGSCLPKDVAALLATADRAGFEFLQLQATVEANRRQRDLVVEKIAKAAGGALEGSLIAIWGLTFKAGTDDVRDSPSLDIVRSLLDFGARVRAYDPVASIDAARAAAAVEIVHDPYDVCDGAHVLAVLTDWDEFRWLDFTRVRNVMTEPRVVDARNTLDAAWLVRCGFDYEGMGRRGTNPAHIGFSAV